MQGALYIERAARPDRIIIGREPGSSGPPPGIAKLHEEIPFGFALRRGLVIVEHAAPVDPVQMDVLVFVGREFFLLDQPLDERHGKQFAQQIAVEGDLV
jgi:hypothetical protein